MVNLPLWMLVAATLGWCGAALGVSFGMARQQLVDVAAGPTFKRKKEGAGATAVAAISSAVMKGPFLVLPFTLLSALLPWANARVVFNFTYCWVTPCKLLLLAFANFPIDCPSWSLSHFSRFLLALLLPVRIKGLVKGTLCSPHGSLHSLLFDLCALICFLSLYDSMAPPVRHVAHCLVLYLVLDLPHRISSMALFLLCGVETQPAFCKPWLSTSLTDFWGKRWDLTANALLRHSVYNPVVNFLVRKREDAAGPNNSAGIQFFRSPSSSAAVVATSAKKHVEPLALQSIRSHLHSAPSSLVSAPSLLVPLPLMERLIAVNTTFFISGLIHELLYFSLTQAAAPTWQVTAFFIMHGLATSAEITLRRACQKHAIFEMSRTLKVVLTMSFIYTTSAWLFFPQLVRADIFRKCTFEYRVIKETVGMTLGSPLLF